MFLNDKLITQSHRCSCSKNAFKVFVNSRSRSILWIIRFPIFLRTKPLRPHRMILNLNPFSDYIFTKSLFLNARKQLGAMDSYNQFTQPGGMKQVQISCDNCAEYEYRVIFVLSILLEIVLSAPIRS